MEAEQSRREFDHAGGSVSRSKGDIFLDLGGNKTSRLVVTESNDRAESWAQEMPHNLTDVETFAKMLIDFYPK